MVGLLVDELAGWIEQGFSVQWAKWAAAQGFMIFRALPLDSHERLYHAQILAMYFRLCQEYICL
jgi:hypothetical protein